MLLKRPLFYISMSFVAGMYILSFCTAETAVLFSVCLTLVFTVILIRKFSTKNVLVLLICALMFILGCVRYETANSIERKSLYKYLDKETTIYAEVVEPPVHNKNSISFIGKIDNEKVRFSHFTQDNSILDEKLIPKIGDVICTDATITLPNSSMNRGGFDYRQYLKGQNIFFQSNISLEDTRVIEHRERTFLHRWINFRFKCISFFDEVIKGEEGSVLKAFVLGDKSSLSEETGISFSASGLSHILAVSGLHVSVFVNIISYVLKKLKISIRKQMGISVLFTMFYIFFTGASVSAIRAGIMLIVAYVAKFIYRKSDSISVLSEVAAIMCFINPHVIFDASFMLSFAVTAGIITLSESISVWLSPMYRKFEDRKVLFKNLKNIADLLAVSLSAQIFTIPLVIYLFKGFSVMSVISTIAVTQLLSLTLVFGMLFCAASFINPLIAYPFAGGSCLLAKMIILISDFFGGFSFSRINFGKITPFFLLLYSLIIATFFFLIKKEKLKYIISLISSTSLITIYLIYSLMTYDVAQVSFINVGQGDCALIKAPGNCDILIDAGGYENSENTGEYIILPYLIQNGVYDIEYVVLTHFHADHTVGMNDLFDDIKIDNLVIPYNTSQDEEAEKIIKKAKEKNINIIYFVHGDYIKINDDMKLKTILPDKLQYAFSENDNEMCLMLRLDYGNNSFLFTGDATSFAEKYSVGKYKDMLDVDVLKVSHHGSKYSSCKEFLEATTPKYAYIPVGNNSFGHPHENVIDRLNSCGSEIYRSDIHKDVTFYFDKERIKGVIYDKRALEGVK